MSLRRSLRLSNSFAAGVAVSMALLASQGAKALDMSRSGDVLRLSGPINAGDQFAFRDATKDVSAGAALNVDLDSSGGNILAAEEIARKIREKGWATLVDGSRSRCASACTLLFAAGVRRHYVNAQGLADGVVGKGAFRGLGYHEGNAPTSQGAHHYSGAATAEMIGMYYELGSSRASEVIEKAPPNKLYRVSGQTALAMGLATSLGKP